MQSVPSIETITAATIASCTLRPMFLMRDFPRVVWTITNRGCKCDEHTSILFMAMDRIRRGHSRIAWVLRAENTGGVGSQAELLVALT
jgi:hypothetical protein